VICVILQDGAMIAGVPKQKIFKPIVPVAVVPTTQEADDPLDPLTHWYSPFSKAQDAPAPAVQEKKPTPTVPVDQSALVEKLNKHRPAPIQLPPAYDPSSAASELPRNKRFRGSHFGVVPAVQAKNIEDDPRMSSLVREQSNLQAWRVWIAAGMQKRYEKNIKSLQQLTSWVSSWFTKNPAGSSSKVKRQAYHAEPIGRPSALPKQRVSVDHLESGISMITLPVLQQKPGTRWIGKEGSVVMQSIPGLLWSNVRMEDGGNCGYHALKNLLIVLAALQDNQGKDINSLVAKDLNSVDLLLPFLEKYTPMVYQERLSAIKSDLGISGEKAMSDDELKKKRNELEGDFLKSFVNINDGHVKTDYLTTFEAQLLVNNLPEKFKRFESKIIILSDHDSEILMNPESELHATMQFLNANDPESAMVLQHSLNGLQSFKNAQDDILGVLWTEINYRHWIAYAIQKVDGKIVAIYYLNSASHKLPNKVKELFELFGIVENR